MEIPYAVPSPSNEIYMSQIWSVWLWSLRKSAQDVLTKVIITLQGKSAYKAFPSECANQWCDHGRNKLRMGFVENSYEKTSLILLS